MWWCCCAATSAPGQLIGHRKNRKRTILGHYTPPLQPIFYSTKLTNIFEYPTPPAPIRLMIISKLSKNNITVTIWSSCLRLQCDIDFSTIFLHFFTSRVDVSILVCPGLILQETFTETSINQIRIIRNPDYFLNPWRDNRRTNPRMNVHLVTSPRFFSYLRPGLL